VAEVMLEEAILDKNRYPGQLLQKRLAAEEEGSWHR